MADEPHEVVTLLLKRMESHPEEFRVGGKPYSDRWDEHISDIQTFGNAVDTAALDAKLRDIRLAEIHERVMDELLNGDDRRRMAREEQEYERNLKQSLLLTKHQMVQQAQQGLQNAYANPLGQLGLAQAVGLAPSSKSVLPIANGGTGETLESTLGKLKKLVRR